MPKSVDFKIDDTQLSDARDVINSFYFYDVKKYIQKYSKYLPTLSYEVKDGLILTISSINPEDGGESWVIINAKSSDKKSEKMAQEITTEVRPPIEYSRMAMVGTPRVVTRSYAKILESFESLLCAPVPSGLHWSEYV